MNNGPALFAVLLRASSTDACGCGSGWLVCFQGRPRSLQGAAREAGKIDGRDDGKLGYRQKRPSRKDRWPNVVRRCDSGEASG
ncbi:hypothetical protein F5X68DRAFT_206682 [Plectosphaerella plurivora]|uniref:Secreted protein n=1 Tax=Plectosphaerella plurivora TaxID=936078 RepID=A0A9P8VDX2_9PEZI|nr:hypothetical protein F5X68DRAFT_206682 [Plectosphaerella plurivora]